ncbi:hypothetical protein ACQEUV_05630 [Micromonospora aurantiaca (nom. illeg.)]|uniref:hypothetical protein n=1 Tax=Micromonospora aurantiaca (nom. illeg.) TaxID=47850 RepID=UPI003DA2059C
MTVGAVAVVFLRLGWWQWVHARAGNTLSYGYALQWPLFAAFGIFFWIKVVRERLSRGVSGRLSDRDLPSLGLDWRFARDGAALDAPVAQPAPAAAAVDTADVGDSRANAYEALLRWLNEDSRRHISDYPGPRYR